MFILVETALPQRWGLPSLVDFSTFWFPYFFAKFVVVSEKQSLHLPFAWRMACPVTLTRATCHNRSPLVACVSSNVFSVAIATFPSLPSSHAGDLPPALLSGPQDVKDEDVIANPSYDVVRI